MHQVNQQNNNAPLLVVLKTYLQKEKKFFDLPVVCTRNEEDLKYIFDLNELDHLLITDQDYFEVHTSQ